MLIFTVGFMIFARLLSGGLPYGLVVYSALLPWNCFAQALSRRGSSLVGSAGLITKVYFPRRIVPIAAVVARFWISPSRLSSSWA